MAKVPAVWYVRFVCVCVWGGGGLMTSVPAVWSVRFVRGWANGNGTCCVVCMLCGGGGGGGGG